MTTIYLAGPDVFLADAEAAGLAKKDLCAAHGFVGRFPLDAELAMAPDAHLSTRIYEANLNLLQASDVVVANLTPFRGVSADVGTVFEVAYALALRKPIFAYTNAAESLLNRVALNFGRRAEIRNERTFADDGMVIEDFGLAENLMIVEAIRAQGWDIVARAVPADRIMIDLGGFEACLVQLKAHLGEGGRTVAAA